MNIKVIIFPQPIFHPFFKGCVICLLVFDLFCYTYCKSLGVSVSASCLKCLPSSQPQTFCLLLFCWRACRHVKSASCRVRPCVRLPLSLILEVLWLQVCLSANLHGLLSISEPLYLCSYLSVSPCFGLPGPNNVTKAEM